MVHNGGALGLQAHVVHRTADDNGRSQAEVSLSSVCPAQKVGNALHVLSKNLLACVHARHLHCQLCACLVQMVLCKVEPLPRNETCNLITATLRSDHQQWSWEKPLSWLVGNALTSFTVAHRPHMQDVSRWISGVADYADAPASGTPMN